MRSLGVLVLAGLALAGCAKGGLSGSSLLAPTQYAAAKPASAVGGIVGGGLVMGKLGEDLSRRERLAAIEAEYRALEATPAGEPVLWRDERSGRTGTVTAAQPYRVGSQDCRPYTHVVNTDGSARTARGTACRNGDGSWTLLN